MSRKLKQFRENHGTFFFKPYPWQERALKTVHENNTTGIISSNKIGKCLTYQTLIDTPTGKHTVGSLFEKRKPFNVYAWDGEKKVTAKAHAPFKKHGLHKCYRVIMSDGQWFEAADHHRILTPRGWKSIQDVLRKFSSIPHESTLDTCRSVRAGDGQHLIQTKSNYQDDYSEDFCRYDAQSLLSQDNDQVFSPLPNDFQEYNPFVLNRDALEKKYKHILSVLASLPCRVLQYVARSVEFLTQSVYNNFEQLTNGRLISPQLAVVSASGFQSYPEAYPQCHDTLLSYEPPISICDNKIVSYRFIGVNPCYDFTVEKYHNYLAGGLIHHNTALVVNILISWLLGYEPWNYAKEGVTIGRQTYKKSSLGIKPPVDLILTGEDWKSHIGRVLVPELKRWAPKDWYTTKRNEQGVEYLWTWNNKSTLSLMSYSQSDDLYESFRTQGVVMDEPPPKSKYTSMSRGLLLDRGKTVLSLTPIKEAWILDDLVLSGRKDVGIVDGLKITDNPELYKSDCDVLKAFNKEQIQRYFDLILYEDIEKKTPVTDKGAKAERYLESLNVSDEDISKLKILKFVKDIDPEDVPPRVFGMFKSLVGRVLKEFSDDIHIIEPFDVPTDWPVTVMIDFHLSTPQAISYWAVNKQDINYVIGETWKNLSAEEIGDDIIRKAKKGWNITEAYIDPLSKGDLHYMRNRIGTNARDTFTILDEKLSQQGITLYVASKDKDSGIKNLQTWLRGPNKMPTMYVFNDCPRHLYEVKRWVFDDNGKPAKDGYDHMMENAYRYTLTGAGYTNQEITSLPVKIYSAGGWMGA